MFMPYFTQNFFDDHRYIKCFSDHKIMYNLSRTITWKNYECIICIYEYICVCVCVFN